ncbi:hypothetical protein NW754_013599 [Fusarium falciforme]|nr:hypothetical protein NW754_013599 [Fusarium falciforme]
MVARFESWVGHNEVTFVEQVWEDGYDFELLPGTVDTSGNVTIGATEAPAAATA